MLNRQNKKEETTIRQNQKNRWFFYFLINRDYIRKKVIEYTMTQLPEELKTSKEEVCFFLENDDGEILAGVTGTMY